MTSSYCSSSTSTAPAATASLKSTMPAGADLADSRVSPSAPPLNELALCTLPCTRLKLRLSPNMTPLSSFAGKDALLGYGNEGKGSFLCYLQNKDVRGDRMRGDGVSRSPLTPVEVTPILPSSVPALLTPFHTGARIPICSRCTHFPQSQLEQLAIACNGKTPKTRYPRVGFGDH